MSAFRDQIYEDIASIQGNYVCDNPLLQKDEYAFNYWILAKLYNVDEEIIENFITEYKDEGIDCYFFNEESKELFIIQNKYYDDSTQLSRTYIRDDFLTRPLSSLRFGTYKRSTELQDIFNKYKSDGEFQIHMYLYVSNDLRDDLIEETFVKFQNPYNDISCYIDARLFYLSDIMNVYYGERYEKKKSFKCDFLTINDGTVLNINKDDYKLPHLIEAKYILTPVYLIFRILKEAKDKGYSLFDENIREYLGNKGINARIANTLLNKDDRANFFYYNNGITIICDKIVKENSYDLLLNRRFVSYNPQIVNGCQTVNSIYEVLKKYKDEDMVVEFRDTFVMVKLLVLKDEDSNLYHDIVRYNNSQNVVTEKSFDANRRIYFDLQKELELRGFLLAVKQSDYYSFKVNKRFNDFRALACEYEDLFGLVFSTIDDIIIPVEKFLQVILCFDKGGYYAFTKKNQVLKPESAINKDIVEFIKSRGVTIDYLLKIYLLFMKAEKEKKESEDKKTPISYYLIGFIGDKFALASSEKMKRGLSFLFSSKKNIDNIYTFYKNVTKLYKRDFYKQKGIEYNVMVKTPIDNTILVQSVDAVNEIFDIPDAKNTIKALNSLLS